MPPLRAKTLSIPRLPSESIKTFPATCQFLDIPSQRYMLLTFFDVLGEKLARQDVMQRHDHLVELRARLVPEELFLNQLKYLLGYDQVSLSEC